MRNLYTRPVAIAVLLLVACQTDNEPAPEASAVCADAERIAILPPELAEASGIVASQDHPGVFWVHNDSEAEPMLYALDANGQLIASLPVPGVTQSDWEDIALGTCPAGTCLYIGDIGDNLHDREDRAILRIAEPDPTAGSVGRVERFPFRYPEGPEDAEAMFVMPDGTVFIITKGRSRPVSVYRYPGPLREGERVALEPVQQLTPGLVQLPEQVTGADALPDGSRILVRTYAHLQLYALAGDTLAPQWPEPGYDLHELAEPQGEGVALLADGTVYLVSETGPMEEPAPMSRVRCTLE